MTKRWRIGIAVAGALLLAGALTAILSRDRRFDFLHTLHPRIPRETVDRFSFPGTLFGMNTPRSDAFVYDRKRTLEILRALKRELGKLGFKAALQTGDPPVKGRWDQLDLNSPDLNAAFSWIHAESRIEVQMLTGHYSQYASKSAAPNGDVLVLVCRERTWFEEKAHAFGLWLRTR